MVVYVTGSALEGLAAGLLNLLAIIQNTYMHACSSSLYFLFYCNCVWLAVASPSIRVLAICHNPPSAHAATLTACALQHHDKNI
jgi:hypothetical protein